MMRFQHSSTHHIRGFTIIELMIVIVIVGILAALAVPSYTDYIRKSRRADAMDAIMSLQLAQEKFRGNCIQYAQGMNADPDNYVCDNAVLPPNNNNVLTHPDISSDLHYDLTILNNTTAISYAIRATPVVGDDQENDSCGYFELKINLLDPDGEIQPIQKLTGSGDANRCWQR